MKCPSKLEAFVKSEGGKHLSRTFVAKQLNIEIPKEISGADKMLEYIRSYVDEANVLVPLPLTVKCVLVRTVEVAETATLNITPVISLFALKSLDMSEAKLKEFVRDAYEEEILKSATSNEEEVVKAARLKLESDFDYQFNAYPHTATVLNVSLEVSKERLDEIVAETLKNCADAETPAFIIPDASDEEEADGEGDPHDSSDGDDDDPWCDVCGNYRTSYTCDRCGVALCEHCENVHDEGHYCLGCYESILENEREEQEARDREAEEEDEEEEDTETTTT